MIQIFCGKNGNYCIRTSCLTTDDFVADLSEAIGTIAKESDGDVSPAIMGVLSQAMPIAFKLSGYKAETVQEQRTLVCGSVLSHESDLIATAGR